MIKTVKFSGLKMRILLFGGVSFIGTNIARLALEKGHSVIAFDNLSRKGVKQNLFALKKLPNFKFILGDIRKPSDFKKIPKKIDFVINLAANPSVPKSITNPKLDCEINILGHINILEYVKRNGSIPIIFASSNKVYSDKVNTYSLVEKGKRYEVVRLKFEYGFSENSDVHGLGGFTNSPYGASKLAGAN